MHAFHSEHTFHFIFINKVCLSLASGGEFLLFVLLTLARREGVGTNPRRFFCDFFGAVCDGELKLAMSDAPFKLDLMIYPIYYQGRPGH